jgi:hypothetical protein
VRLPRDSHVTTAVRATYPGGVTGPNDDAVWREIVANYGDRPVVDADEHLTRVERPTHAAEPEGHPELADHGWQEERFVPPPPPPLPRVPKDRLAAWLGVFGSPVLLLLATVLRLPLPTLVPWLLVGAFLGGFGYLIAQMPRGPRDPFDDGAVL